MRPWRSTFVTNGVILASGLAGGILAARFLGAEQRGLFAAIIFWPNFIAEIATLGLNESIVIRTARFGATDNLRATTCALSIALAIVVGGIGYSLMPLLLGELRRDYVPFAKIYFLAFLPITFLAQNLLAVDQGEFKFLRFNAQRIVQAVAYPLLLLAFWLSGGLTVERAAISVLAGTAVVALNRVWFARKGLSTRPSVTEAGQLLAQGFRLHVVNVVSFLSTQIDKMILVLYSSNTQIGLYTVAFSAAAAVPALFVQTYINIMFPAAAKLGAQQENIHEILVPLRKLVGITVLISALFVLLMPYLISLVYGHEFDAAGEYAQILVVASCFVSIKKVVVYLLRSWHLNLPAILGEGFTALLLSVGAFLAVQWWGTMGLCILVLLAHAAGTGLMVFYFSRATGVNLRQFMRPNAIPAR